jgi:hypothetical protein
VFAILATETRAAAEQVSKLQSFQGAATFSIMTLGILTHSKTLIRMPLSIMEFSTIEISIIDLKE